MKKRIVNLFHIERAVGRLRQVFDFHVPKLFLLYRVFSQGGSVSLTISTKTVCIIGI